MQIPELFIGLVGPMNAGKDTVGEAIIRRLKQEEITSCMIRFSDPIKAICQALEMDISQDREPLQYVPEIFNKAGCGSLIPVAVLKRAQKQSTQVVIMNGMRWNPHDYEMVKSVGGLVVSVDALFSKRLERYRNNPRFIGAAAITVEEFEESHRKRSEVDIPVIMASADFAIENNFDILGPVDSIVDFLVTSEVLPRLTKPIMTS